jgi:hypothetical protein
MSPDVYVARFFLLNVWLFFTSVQTMEQLRTIQNQQLNVSVEMLFANPIPYRAADLDGFSQKALASFREYGLGALHIFQREGDRLYDYDVTFSLFNRNGNFRLASEKLIVVLQNARGEADVALIKAALLKITECLTVADVTENIINSTSQAVFSTKEERDEFLSNLAHTREGLSCGGVVYYGKFEPSPSEMRFQIDRSGVFPEGVFLSWMSAVKGRLTGQLLTDTAGAFGSILAKFGLTLK